MANGKRSIRRCLVASTALLLLVAGVDGAALATPPPTPSFSAQIDSYATYDGQDTCDPTAKPGTIDLRNMLLNAYPGTTDLGITRSCGSGGVSEHKEGRAWDWGANAFNATQKAQVDEALGWLLATDQFGNRHANARRLGIMYMIWNKRIFRMYRPNEGWQPYSGSSPHTDHVHFSQSFAGALKRTSWWGGSAAPRLENLYSVRYAGANSRTEAHVIRGSANYQNFIFQTTTALPSTNATEWAFVTGAARSNGVRDLLAVDAQGTNGRTDIHVLDGANNYQRFVVQTPTALPAVLLRDWVFTAGAVRPNGLPDVFAIRKGTSTRRAEVHVLDGANNWQSFRYQTTVPLNQATPSEWTAVPGAENSSGINDVNMIRAAQGQAVESHLLEGQNNHQSFVFQTPTAGTTPDASRQWYAPGASLANTLKDVNLVRLNSASQLFEAHLLDGLNNYQSYVFETATPLSGGSTPSAWTVAR